jgi:N6-L-threonylcarbamoyladenine synthase
MKILAIETSCDETAIALLEVDGGLRHPKFKILKNLVASQIKIHRPFGGVVPNLAKREHIKNLPILYKKLAAGGCKLAASGYTLNPNLIAVTVGPGLEPCLWTGINFAKDLLKAKSYKLKTKLIGVNHLEGHLYSLLLDSKFYFLDSKKIFPAVALLVSGGHTILILMKDLVHYKKIGETRDDAAGEAFDKVARLLNLPYPGGPEIEKLAKLGNPEAIDFPRPMINQKNYDFSFSGLKTAALYYIRDKSKATSGYFRSAALRASGHGAERSEASERAAPVSELAGRANDSEKISARCLSDVAASFQQAAFDVLIKKTLRAAEDFNAKSIFLTGGVAANKTLQKEFKKKLKVCSMSHVACPILLATKYPTDNAAMIAAAAYVNYLRKKNRRLIANGNLSL